MFGEGGDKGLDGGGCGDIGSVGGGQDKNHYNQL